VGHHPGRGEASQRPGPGQPHSGAAEYGDEARREQQDVPVKHGVRLEAK